MLMMMSSQLYTQRHTHDKKKWSSCQRGQGMDPSKVCLWEGDGLTPSWPLLHWTWPWTRHFTNNGCSCLLTMLLLMVKIITPTTPSMDDDVKKEVSESRRAQRHPYFFRFDLGCACFFLGHPPSKLASKRQTRSGKLICSPLDPLLHPFLAHLYEYVCACECKESDRNMRDVR